MRAMLNAGLVVTLNADDPGSGLSPSLSLSLLSTLSTSLLLYSPSFLTHSLTHSFSFSFSLLFLCLEINPLAYFFGHVDKWGGTHGGYLPANYVVTAHECGLSADEVVVLARNSLESSFASPREKEGHIAALRAYVENFATTTI